MCPAACSKSSFQAKHLFVLLTLLQRFSGTTWMFSPNVPSSESWQDALVSYSSSFPIFSPLSAFTSLRPSERFGSVARTAHSARRGLGDVLAALRATPGVRQPLLENGHFEAHLDILLNFFICGENPSLANSSRRFFGFFFLLLILFQMIVSPLRRSVGRSDFSSPRVTVTGRNGNALNT